MTAPPLPRPVGRRSFLKQTVAEWESWPWDDFTPAQAAHAARTIVLIDDLNRAGSATERMKLDQAVRQALRVLGLTKRADEDDPETIEARRVEDARLSAERFRVSQQRQAIRAGVEVTDLHKRFRDRGGRLRDLREILWMDTWDSALEDERQAEAESAGLWPDAPTGIPFAEGVNE